MPFYCMISPGPILFDTVSMWLDVAANVLFSIASASLKTVGEATSLIKLKLFSQTFGNVFVASLH